MVPETGIEPVRPLSGKRRILSPLCLPISPLRLISGTYGFLPKVAILIHTTNKKSALALFKNVWRRGAESNRPRWLCRPLHNRFATAPRVRIVTANIITCPCKRSVFCPHQTTLNEKGKLQASLFRHSGAGEESRTLDLNLGKVALYQLSYSRVKQKRNYSLRGNFVKPTYSMLINYLRCL